MYKYLPVNMLLKQINLSIYTYKVQNKTKNKYVNWFVTRKTPFLLYLIKHLFSFNQLLFENICC